MRIFLLWNCLLFLCNFAAFSQSQTVPANNPVATRFGVDAVVWTQELPWANTINILTVQGATWNERLEKAQIQLLEKGGGVVFFPAGTYKFDETILLKSHCIIRGETPKGVADAYDGEYALATQFDFPQYQPQINGASNQSETAFKGIELENPNTTTHCGVINIDLHFGHIKFGVNVYQAQHFADGFANYGSHHVVFGCILRNAAIADPNVPHQWQKPWQIWTHRHNAAIDIRAKSNVLVANNRIPESTAGDFLMPGYAIKAGTSNTGETVTRDDITFRYDNRPGIYVNYGTITGTPDVAPHCYAKGIEIRDNYIYCYGCMGIGFSGDGTYCGGNVIRFKPNNYLPIYNGTNMSHHVNNNRAIEIRALRWTVERNNYEVYSNSQPTDDWGGYYGDGEGIMHEQHDNVAMIKDSKLLYNIGNRYLCMWRTPIDGLEIRGNVIRTSPNSHAANASPAICIQGKVHNQETLLEIKNVKIIDNYTGGTGIRMLGIDKGGNEISRNNFLGPVPKGTIELTMPKIKLKDNATFEVTDKISYY